MRKSRKIILTTLKVLVAVGLLAWVFSKVSWQDYVIGKDKQAYSLAQPALPGQTVYDLNQGKLWWKKGLKLEVSQLAPVEDSSGNTVLKGGKPVYVRPGVLSSIEGIDLAFLALAVSGLLISIFIMAVRYWFLLRIQEIHIKLWESVRLTFLGTFFNYFMPGTVGGDLVKAYYVSKHTHLKAAVWLSVFVDRVLGMTEVVLLAAVMIVISLGTGQSSFDMMYWPILIISIAAGSVVIAITFVLSASFRRIFHLQKIYQRLPIAHHIAAAGEAAKVYRRRIGALTKAIAITVGAQVLSISSVYLLGRSVHIDASPLSYFVASPIIWMLGAMPISPGGAGWVEGLYVTFLGMTGHVDASKTLVLALLARFVQMGVSLPGMIVYFTGSKVPKAAAMEAELAMEEPQSPMNPGQSTDNLNK